MAQNNIFNGIGTNPSGISYNTGFPGDLGHAPLRQTAGGVPVFGSLGQVPQVYSPHPEYCLQVGPNQGYVASGQNAGGVPVFGSPAQFVPQGYVGSRQIAGGVPVFGSLNHVVPQVYSPHPECCLQQPHQSHVDAICSSTSSNNTNCTAVSYPDCTYTAQPIGFIPVPPVPPQIPVGQHPHDEMLLTVLLQMFQEHLDEEKMAILTTLFFEIKRRVCPTVTCPRRKFASFPMSKKAFEYLFCGRFKIHAEKPRRHIHKFHNLRVVYSFIVFDLRDLNYLFGTDWYLSFSGTSVAYHCAPMVIRLVEYILTDTKHILNLDRSYLDPNSVQVRTLTYCNIRFNYKTTTRYDPSQIELNGDLEDLELWKEAVETHIVTPLHWHVYTINDFNK
jgi:hypothetical protein